MGVISAVGSTVDSFWSNILAGRHGISPIEGFDTSGLPVKLAAEVKDFDASAYGMDKKEQRRTDRFCQFAVAAAQQALDSCGTRFEDLDPYRVGVIVGSGIGGLNTLEAEHCKLLEKGPDRVSVFFIPMMISNMAAGTIAMKTGYKGVNYCPVTACATSSQDVYKRQLYR